MAASGTSFLRRLYRGETDIDFIGNRKKWYLASAIIIVICVASIAIRGFNFGIEFAGGNEFQIPVKPGTTLSDVRSAVEDTGVEVQSSQVAGQATGKPSYVIRTAKITEAQRTDVVDALEKRGDVAANEINSSEVSSSWGSDVSKKAGWALLAFLLAVSAYLWIRFREFKVSAAALLALLHDLLLTAGVYSLSGFEVTPGTIIGLLTILGFSLYDTVVVFDKVDENTKGILGSSRYTYGEAANLAVNQTLMRSINTSLIGLLPVAGLLFVGAGLLGVGTLKDLALVLFVGMLTGAYSSLFLATPWLVDFKMFEPRYQTQAKRVMAKRQGDQGKAKAATTVAARQTATADDDVQDEESKQRVDALAGSSGPKVGAKPATARRSSGGRGGRPGGKRRH
ncbi:MAG TPA: protein translocase subunit SecF [Micromonosporaceae bacterium]